MPLDSGGKFRMNAQSAMSHSGGKAPMASKPKMPMAPKGMEHAGAAEHSPVKEHLAAMHSEMGGKHMHVHSDGGKLTSHHVGEDGQVEGPHDHANMDALKQHMDQFLNEEGSEQGGGDQMADSWD